MGRNAPDFHEGVANYSFTFHMDPTTEDVAEHQHRLGDMVHMVKAWQSGTPVGYLKWSSGHGEVADVEVLKPHRRQGIATEMWNQAHLHSSIHNLVPPEHSSARTAQGSAWAATTGTTAPEKDRIPYIRQSKRDFLHMFNSYDG